MKRRRVVLLFGLHYLLLEQMFALQLPQSRKCPGKAATRRKHVRSYYYNNINNCGVLPHEERRLSVCRSSTSSSSSSDTDDVLGPIRRRASIAGVSVSSTGFWVVLRTDGYGEHQRYIPLRATDDPADQTAATSAEALTLMQLLAGVDMAGTILPPELLSQVVVLACEEVDEDVEEDEPAGGTSLIHRDDDNDDEADIRQRIRSAVRESIAQVYETLQSSDRTAGAATLAYAEQNEWIRSRVRLPSAALDQVTIISNNNNDQFVLQCSVNDCKLSVPLTRTILEHVCHEYRPAVSSTFVALGLALRYKAPILFVFADYDTVYYNDRSALQERFPNYRDIADALQPADRSAENILRGFEIFKLQAALDLARNRGDTIAATKIRAALDKLDEQSLAKLPVQPDSDTSSMQ